MLFLLFAALIGDLILLPAILAGPFGKYFCNIEPKEESAALEESLTAEIEETDQGDEPMETVEPLKIRFQEPGKPPDDLPTQETG